MNTTLVIVEPKAHRRLRLVDGLRATHTIQPLTSIDGALRHIRVQRPGIVLIGVGRRTEPALRLARQIKTDGGNQAFIGLIDWSGRLKDPQELARSCGANGIYIGEPSKDALVAFVAKLMEEEGVAIAGSAPIGIIGRLLKS